MALVALGEAPSTTASVERDYATFCEHRVWRFHRHCRINLTGAQVTIYYLLRRGSIQFIKHSGRQKILARDPIA